MNDEHFLQEARLMSDVRAIGNGRLAFNAYNQVSVNSIQMLDLLKIYCSLNNIYGEQIIFLINNDALTIN